MGKIHDALVRAAKAAREEARRHGQPVVIWKDGKVVLEYPDPAPAASPHQPG
jgi:hypothetical protein